MFGNNRFVGDERFALSVFIDGRHSEFVGLSGLQVVNFAFCPFAELADRSPLSSGFVLFLNHVVGNRIASVVLTKSVHNVFLENRHLVTFECEN